MSKDTQLNFMATAESKKAVYLCALFLFDDFNIDEEPLVLDYLGNDNSPWRESLLAAMADKKIQFESSEALVVLQRLAMSDDISLSASAMIAIGNCVPGGTNALIRLLPTHRKRAESLLDLMKGNDK